MDAEEEAKEEEKRGDDDKKEEEVNKDEFDEQKDKKQASGEPEEQKDEARARSDHDDEDEPPPLTASRIFKGEAFLEYEEFLEGYFGSELSDHINRPKDYTANLGVPKSCKNAFFAYELSEETLRLLSEARRTVFPELYIKDERLGPLTTLCVKALSRANIPPEISPLISENPEMVRIYWEECPLATTLDKALTIDNDIYWRRFVVEKHHDKGYALIKEANWRNIGICLLLAEKVEAAAPEWWDNDDYVELAEQIRPYVTELTLTKLQTQSEKTFDEYYENAENELWESSLDSAESIFLEEEGHDDGNAASPYNDAIEDDEVEAESEDVGEEHAATEKVEEEALPEPPPPPPKKKRKKKKKGLSIIDIEVADSDTEIREQELEAEKCDGRNQDKYLMKLRNFNYPTKICHHIDLSFIKLFDQLQEFNLSFSGDGHIFDYHEKHLKFSYRDMANLAFGLRFLHNLKIFRFTKSRMNKRKLKTVIQALKWLPNLEVVDFSLDHLKDDCGHWFYELLSKSHTLRSLELQSNELGSNVMRWIGYGLRKHEGTIIEYLGLARNPIGDAGLRNLFSGMQGTHQVQHLDLTGISCSNRGALTIANELIGKHQACRHLILVGIDIGSNVVDTFIDRLINNTSLIEIDVRCCGLNFESEYEICLLEKRNQYLAQNQVNDELNIEDLEDFFQRVKHPLLLKVFEDINKYKECLDNKPPEFLPYSEESQSEHEVSSETLHAEQSFTEMEVTQICVDSATSTFEFPVVSKREKFEIQFDNLNESEFVHYCSTGGHDNRFKYFRTLRRHHNRAMRRFGKRVSSNNFTRTSMEPQD